MAQQKRSGGAEPRGIGAELARKSNEELQVIVETDPRIGPSAQRELDKRARAAARPSVWNEDWEV